MKKVVLASVVSLCIGITYVNAELVRNDSKNIVTDSSNGLMWQDEKYTTEEEIATENIKNYGKAGNWEYAKQYCEDLRYAGYNNWRLPTKDELLSIGDKNANTSYKVRVGFINIDADSYWADTSSNESSAPSVNFRAGVNIANGMKFFSRYIRCVR